MELPITRALFVVFAFAASLTAQTSSSIPRDEEIATKFQLYQTQAQLYRAQNATLNILQQQQAANLEGLRKEAEAKYPGYTLNLQSGTLMPLPSPAEVPSSKKEH